MLSPPTQSFRSLAISIFTPDIPLTPFSRIKKTTRTAPMNTPRVTSSPSPMPTGSRPYLPKSIALSTLQPSPITVSSWVKSRCVTATGRKRAGGHRSASCHALKISGYNFTRQVYGPHQVGWKVRRPSVASFARWATARRAPSAYGMTFSRPLNAIMIALRAAVSQPLWVMSTPKAKKWPTCTEM